MRYRDRMPDRKLQRAKSFRAAPTPSEAAAWSVLRQHPSGHRFRRQAPLLGYIVDFLSPRTKLVVEIDGRVHATRAQADAERDARLAAHGYRTLRVPAASVLADPSSLLRLLSTC
jgi:very-short-patch-repair endonuclease